MRQFKDTFGAQNVQVSRHGCRVAGDVNDLGRAEPTQELEEIGRAANTRRINQY
jgi:hypothetical protein